MLTDQIITNSFINFGNTPIENLNNYGLDNISGLSELDVYFGSIHLITNNVIKDTTEKLHHHFIFTIDTSNSMSQYCSDNVTKIQHIKNTIINMFQVFSNINEYIISVSIYTFNINIDVIIENMIVSLENTPIFIKTIQEVKTDEATNIEIALQNSNTEIEKYKALNPSHLVSHIFMTDGDATKGSNDPEYLKQFVNENVINTFIGFGIQHNFNLLKNISNQRNDNYYFIDVLENCGLVYGEIIHNILYNIIENIEITIENGLIYNWKQNCWQDKLYIGNMVRNFEKTYHIVSEKPHLCKAHIKYLYNNIIFNKSIVTCNIVNMYDIQKYMFRQETFQLLHEAKNFNYLLKIYDYDLYKSNMEHFKKKLENILQIMNLYMDNLDSTSDKFFIKNLCDDIYIAYKTFNTKYGKLYSYSRQTSQGQQRTYSVTNLSNICDKGLLKRNSKHFFNLDNNPCDNINSSHKDIFDSYQISNNIDTPYRTISMSDMMREVSGNNSVFINF
jgi:hypothetical protein